MGPRQSIIAPFGANFTSLRNVQKPGEILGASSHWKEG
jgi:hypothetical protein